MEKAMSPCLEYMLQHKVNTNSIELADLNLFLILNSMRHKGQLLLDTCIDLRFEFKPHVNVLDQLLSTLNVIPMLVGLKDVSDPHLFMLGFEMISDRLELTSINDNASFLIISIDQI